MLPSSKVCDGAAVSGGRWGAWTWGKGWEFWGAVWRCWHGERQEEGLLRVWGGLDSCAGDNFPSYSCFIVAEGYWPLPWPRQTNLNLAMVLGREPGVLFWVQGQRVMTSICPHFQGSSHHKCSWKDITSTVVVSFLQPTVPRSTNYLLKGPTYFSRLFSFQTKILSALGLVYTNTWTHAIVLFHSMCVVLLSAHLQLWVLYLSL